MLVFERKTFSTMSATDIYAVLQLRQDIFVVEQKCPFREIDDIDQVSHHVLGWEQGVDGRKFLAAYCRIIPVYVFHNFPDPAVGRLCTAASVRQKGYGRLIFNEGVKYLEELYPGSTIRIQAQQYLERFYQSCGFKTISEPYDEDGIQHIDMLRPAGTTA
jgi:ElaA protein